MVEDAGQSFGQLAQGPLLRVGKTGERARHAIRPEHIAIGRYRDELWDGNVLQGTVRKTVFMGNLAYYDLDCDGLTLVVQSHADRFQVGDDLCLHLPPDRLQPII